MNEVIYDEPEIFKILNEFPNYKISNYGRVYNIKRNCFLKGHKIKSGIIVTLQRKVKLVHILVAENFLSNDNNYPYVLHNDNNNYNNYYKNLYWASSNEKAQRDSENIRKSNLKDYQNKLNQGFVSVKYKNQIIEGYLINRDGLIYSNYKNSFLRFMEDKDGYYEVIIKHKKLRVASLVGYTFLGPPPDFIKDPTINHIDNNIHNNNYNNLEWMERGLNSSIRRNKGEGSLNPATSVTESQVKKICELLLTTNLTYEEIGQKMRVGKDTVARIKQGRSWKKIIKQYPDLSYCREMYKDSQNKLRSYNPLISKENEVI